MPVTRDTQGLTVGSWRVQRTAVAMDSATMEYASARMVILEMTVP